MTKPWKLKINSSNILLVLITLILVKAEWIEEGNDTSGESINTVESNGDQNQREKIYTYVGNDEIAEYFFHSSVKNDSFILEGINNCLDSFQLVTCVKMLLLSKINDALNLMEQPSVREKDVNLLNGLLKFKLKNKTFSLDLSKKEDLSLDEEIDVKVKRIFQERSLLIYLFPKLAIEIEPAFRKNEANFICFTYQIRNELGNSEKIDENEGRKRKRGGMSMMMMVPQLIMLGLMPFTLASLKAMVMNAVMINMMALNGAIFMTIRNLVFGPRQGDNVKYVNYGYSKDRQTKSKKPVLIIHSPAAFVKQPEIHTHKKQGHRYSSLHHAEPDYFPQSQTSHTGYNHIEDHGDHDDNYYILQQGQNYFQRRGQQDIQRRNQLIDLTKYKKTNIAKKPDRIQKENYSNYSIYLANPQPKLHKSEMKIFLKNHR